MPSKVDAGISDSERASIASALSKPRSLLKK
jgi:hypothetical protein